GVVGAALEDAETWCGLIVDGIHVHPATLKVAISAKQAGKMVLVTDAMPTVGAVEQTFTIRGETITAIDGVCATAEGTLSGSDLNMASAVRNTVELLGQPIEEALRMASLYPAELLGLSSNVGQIKTGFQADLVLLDNALRVKRTWIAGQVQFH
ncbi:MAG: amidohydrolase family protein, partial [Rhodospirillales bacterium]